MSQTFTTPQAAISHEEWERVLVQLRADGFSPIESIKITRAVLRVPLAEAKRIVHFSIAWADARSEFEQIQASVASTANNL
ncbi:MAG: hypothetical protein ACKVWR_13555 [Acidimicrobiales bacterium]